MDEITFAAATDADLAEVRVAGEAFRRHWASFRNMTSDPSFLGDVGDIAALDYLDYEQLGYPEGGLAVAALVWGNVLVARGGLHWVRASAGGLWLSGGDGLSLAALVWPYARLAEFKARGCPQFGQYQALTLWLIGELIATASLPGATHAKLRRLQTALEVGEPDSAGE